MALMAVWSAFHGSPRGCGHAAVRFGDFDRRLRMELRGAQISSDGGLLVMRSGCPIWQKQDCATPNAERTRFIGLFRQLPEAVVLPYLLGSRAEQLIATIPVDPTRET